MTWYALQVSHGDDLTADDFAVLEVVRRTLRGLLDHGVISELESTSGTTYTVWEWLPADRDAAGILGGLVDTLRTLAPDWPYRAGVSLGAARPNGATA